MTELKRICCLCGICYGVKDGMGSTGHTDGYCHACALKTYVEFGLATKDEQLEFDLMQLPVVDQEG